MIALRPLKRREPKPRLGKIEKYQAEIEVLGEGRARFDLLKGCYWRSVDKQGVESETKFDPRKSLWFVANIGMRMIVTSLEVDDTRVAVYRIVRVAEDFRHVEAVLVAGEAFAAGRVLVQRGGVE